MAVSGVPKSILITGGSGFLGHALTRRLLAIGAQRICIYSRGEHAQADMRQEFGDDARLRWMIGDVRDLVRLRRAAEGCATIIHAAALKRIEVGAYNPEEMIATNVGGAMNVLDAACSAGLGKIVFVSSDKAVAPVSPYGLTKALSEDLFRSANTTRPSGPHCTVVRYGNVAGSTGSVIPTWAAAIDIGRPVRLTDPDCTRYWMRIDDAVELVLSAIKSERELLIPQLPAYRLGDLLLAFGVEPDKITGLPAHEKRHETMDGITDSSQARRMSVEELREGLWRLGYAKPLKEAA